MYLKPSQSVTIYNKNDEIHIVHLSPYSQVLIYTHLQEYKRRNLIDSKKVKNFY